MTRFGVNNLKGTVPIVPNVQALRFAKNDLPETLSRVFNGAAMTTIDILHGTRNGSPE